MKKLEGKVALVTESARGIGAANRRAACGRRSIGRY
jgi:NAD(P)-dependent dehydrogenase (short-subunit alcohol dehydrogenase family)